MSKNCKEKHRLGNKFLVDKFEIEKKQYPVAANLRWGGGPSRPIKKYLYTFFSLKSGCFSPKIGMKKKKLSKSSGYYKIFKKINKTMAWTTKP